MAHIVSSIEIAQAQQSAPILLCVRGKADDGGWCEAAFRAAERVRASGHSVIVQDTMPERVGGDWSAIVGHGMECAAELLNIARANPGLSCALTDQIDGGSVRSLGNLCCVDWRWDEGAFLAGVLASRLSTTGVVGVLGGAPCRTQHLAMMAFVKGARFERRGATVLTAQAGRFDDEGRGERLANAIFDEGVDVLLHTADSTGRGAIRAAERRERIVIGFMNQDDRHRKSVAGVITTDVEAVVESLIGSIAAGEFRPGLIHAGLASGMQRFDILRNVTELTRRRIEELAALIASGELRVRSEEPVL